MVVPLFLLQKIVVGTTKFKALRKRLISYEMKRKGNRCFRSFSKIRCSDRLEYGFPEHAFAAFSHKMHVTM